AEGHAKYYTRPPALVVLDASDSRGNRMQYMVIEHFRNGDPLPVYRRFRDHGRLAPEGLRYVASWVTEDFRRCFQVMECEDRALLTQWTARWDDLIEFEVIPVITLSVPVVAGFVLLGAAVLVGRSLLDVGRRLLETKPRAREP